MDDKMSDDKNVALQLTLALLGKNLIAGETVNGDILATNQNHAQAVAAAYGAILQKIKIPLKVN